LKPDDLRTLRKSMGHTQHTLAAALLMGDHGWKTVSEWERGVRAIPGPVQIAVWHLAHCREQMPSIQTPDTTG